MTVTSRDGTTLAFERRGGGPVLILIPAALSMRSGTAKLARLLSSGFTVVDYDRRGRGESTDTGPYSTSREVEDLEALIDAAGGAAYLFGSSSGAALALDAAARLGGKVCGVFVYEPPFIVDESRPPMPAGLSGEIQSLVSAGRRNEAVKRFFTAGMGIPKLAVSLMRWLMPGWSQMAAIAHTIPYDLALLAGTQDGRPLPADRWAASTAPTLVMVGSKSERFFHGGAQALAGLLPQAEYRVLSGGSHASVMMSPGALAEAIRRFFLQEKPNGRPRAVAANLRPLP